MKVGQMKKNERSISEIARQVQVVIERNRLRDLDAAAEALARAVSALGAAVVAVVARSRPYRRAA